jgi:hypothetical protein
VLLCVSMFNLSEKDLHVIQNETPPGTLRALEEKLLELAIEDNPRNFLAKLDCIRGYAGIELQNVNMKNVCDAVEVLQTNTETAIPRAEERVAKQSTKRSSFTPPEPIPLSDEEKAQLRTDLEARSIEREALAAQDKQRRTEEKAMKITNQYTEPTLDHIKDILNPKSKAEKLARDLTEIFSRPENSAVNLFRIDKIRDLILDYAAWNKVTRSQNISFNPSINNKMTNLLSQLYTLLVETIFTNEDCEALINKFGDSIFRDQIPAQINILTNELISKTKLYSASELYKEPEQQRLSIFKKIAGSIKDYLLGGHLF